MKFYSVTSHISCGMIGGLLALSIGGIAGNATSAGGPVKASRFQLMSPDGKVKGEWFIDKEGVPELKLMHSAATALLSPNMLTLAEGKGQIVLHTANNPASSIDLFGGSGHLRLTAIEGGINVAAAANKSTITLDLTDNSACAVDISSQKGRRTLDLFDLDKK